MPTPDVSPQLLDDLSAYLDGELDAVGNRRVEELLARDPRVRSEMQRLERTWTLLNELPRADVGEDFSRTTVEMVAIASQEEVAQRTQALPTQRRIRRLAAATGTVCAALIGFLAVRFLAANPNERVLQDLGLLESLDEYRQVVDIEFLRLLSEQKISPQETGHDPLLLSDARAIGDDLSDRRTQIAGMSPAEKEQLKQKQARLAALSPLEQEKLRELDRLLAADPQADKLRRVMVHYHDWLKNQHPAVREQLRELPPQARLERVQTIRREEQIRGQNQMAPEDRQAILAWLDGIVRSKLAPEKLRQWEQMRPDERRIALRSQIQARFNGGKGKQLPELSADQLTELHRQLSPAARQQLDSRPHPAGKRQLLGQWIVQSLRGPELDGPGGILAGIADDELERFRHTELSAKQRADLDRLGPNEQARRLRMMYLNKKYPDHPWRQLRPGDPPPDKRKPRPGAGPRLKSAEAKGNET